MYHNDAKTRDNIVKDKKIIDVWSDITKTLYNPINAKKARISAFYSMPKETQALYNLREEDGFCEPKDGTKKFNKGALALRWLVNYAKLRNGKGMAVNLANEIMDAATAR